MKLLSSGVHGVSVFEVVLFLRLKSDRREQPILRGSLCSETPGIVA